MRCTRGAWLLQMGENDAGTGYADETSKSTHSQIDGIAIGKTAAKGAEKGGKYQACQGGSDSEENPFEKLTHTASFCAIFIILSYGLRLSNNRLLQGEVFCRNLPEAGMRLQLKSNLHEG